MHGTRSYRYLVVDVFTQVAFEGNPLAVFLDAQGLGDGEMQTIARELNLSETSFVFASERVAARLRIFTPGAEVPFAGHPTIGTAFALVDSGRVPERGDFVLEERVGDVPIRLERARDPFVAWLRTPPMTFGATLERSTWLRGLGLAPEDALGDLPVQVVSAGNPFAFVALRDRDAVDRAQLDAGLMRRELGTSTNGIFVFAPVEGGAYSRMFAPAFGIVEDPATGSATGPLGAYMLEYGLLERVDGARFVSEQGTKMKRRSLISGIVRMRDGRLDTIEIGGSAVRVIEGELTLG